MLRIPHGRLIALRAPSSLDPKADPPNRLLLLKWGDNPTTKGNFRIGPHSLTSLPANQRALGFDEIVLDFEHNTVPGHPSNKGEPAAIAGRGKPVVIEGEGLYLDSLNWTEPGREFREHYHDVSPTVLAIDPVVQLDDNGEVVFVHSAALCRNGATFDLHAFSAGYDFKTLNMTVFDKPGTVNRNDVAVNRNAVDLDLLRKILSLSAEATIEDINRALVTLAASPDKPVTGLTADVSAQLRALHARFDSAERSNIVSDALSKGRIVPKEWLPNEQGEGGLPVDQLRTLCATLPEIVPLEARTPEKLREFTALRPANPISAELDKQLGITPEMNNKWGKD